MRQYVLLLELAEGAAERNHLGVAVLAPGSGPVEAALMVHVATQDLLLRPGARAVTNLAWTANPLPGERKNGPHSDWPHDRERTYDREHLDSTTRSSSTSARRLSKVLCAELT